MIERKDFELRLMDLRERQAKTDSKVQTALLEAQINECEFWLLETAKRECESPTRRESE